MRWHNIFNPIKLIEGFFLLAGGGDMFGGGGDAPDFQAIPTNLQTGFGKANYDPLSGNVSYSLNPILSKFRDYFYDQAGTFKPTEQQTQYANDVYNYGVGLFGRAANLDVNQMSQDYYNQQMAALAPSRAMEESRLGDTLFKSGRTGAGTGYAGGGYVNPEQFSLLKAREEANANLMLNSENRARALQQQDIANALGYANAGQALRTQPLANMAQVLGLGTGVENLGYQQLGTLGQFGQLSNATANAQYQAALAQSQSEGGGLFGGLVGGVLGGASNIFGQGLGNWATGALFASNPALGVGASMLGSTGSNYLGLSNGLGGINFLGS
jgi:hypothetical protein